MDPRRKLAVDAMTNRQLWNRVWRELGELKPMESRYVWLNDAFFAYVRLTDVLAELELRGEQLHLWRS